MQHKLLSNPNINIPLRWFLFRWIRRQSRLCRMESRSWKEKSSGWSRHFLRYFRARNRPFIPSFPPFSNGPDIALIRHQGGRGGGWICIVAVVVDRLSPQWVICRSDERRNQRDSGMETLVSTSFQRLIRKGIDWRYLFRVIFECILIFFNLGQDFINDKFKIVMKIK